MFKQIVSKLSLSPSAIADLSFYSRRLRAEKVTRTFSAVAAVLVVGLQFATILVPPVGTNAASSNDIIHGGFVSKDDLLNQYDSSNELKILFDRFAINRSNLASARTSTIQSKDTSLKSIGRNQHWADDEVITTTAGIYYGRVLHKWDSGANSSYQVLEGTRSDGEYFAVIIRCGNIVYRSLPSPPSTPMPTLTPVPVSTPVATPVPTVRVTTTPAPTPKATPSSNIQCNSLQADTVTGVGSITTSFNTLASSLNQNIKSYTYDFGDTTSQTSSAREAVHTYNVVGTYTATVRVTGSAGTTTAVSSVCSKTITITTTPASFTKSKIATNDTLQSDATLQPASGGDVITYQLSTTNQGGTQAQYTVVEHIQDILEYADIINSSGGTVLDGVLSWPETAVLPQQTLTKSFTVKIKDPIPVAPIGLSDKYSYDLRLDNVYGSQVQIQVTPPAVKQIEQTAATLPETGAGASTIIIIFITSLVLFFYLRSRQLVDEVRILRHDHQGGSF